MVRGPCLGRAMQEKMKCKKMGTVFYIVRIYVRCIVANKVSLQSVTPQLLENHVPIMQVCDKS